MFQKETKGVENMLYVTYEQFKAKYYETQKQYNEILNEKEQLFLKTQPKAIKFDKEKITGGVSTNTFDEYLIEKEKKQIDERLEEVKIILEDRKNLLELKREELKASNNIQDKIYYYRYIDKMRVEKIGRLVGYGEAQVYRILRSIKNNVK